MSPLHARSAVELSAAYRAGEVSPLEVAQAVVDRVQHCEPQLHATWAFDADAVLEQARASAARWQRGEPLSALDGVPVTVKENIATRGVGLPLGCAASDLQPAAADAPPAARLREAGCVFVAKTTMPDYGMLSSGLSSFHAAHGGPTRNPWDLALNPGGSSAGAGAAAAAGYGPLHLGTDIGGSIRLPAGWCGVFGLKPSAGRVPIQPAFTGRVAGPMTRSVHDAALMMSVLSRPDVRDSTRLPWLEQDWTALDLDLRGLRLGLLLDAGWGLPPAPAIVAAVEAAARRLQGAGARVEPMPPFLRAEMAEGIDRFWRLRWWLELSALPADRRARVLPAILDWAAPAAAFDAAQAFHGFLQMAALSDAAVAATAGFDFVLSPVSPVPAFAAERAGPLDDSARAMHHIGFTLPWNMSGQPAASIDCRLDPADLPVGLQIAGRRHDDLGVLRLAHAFERLRPPPPWPAL